MNTVGNGCQMELPCDTQILLQVLLAQVIQKASIDEAAGKVLRVLKSEVNSY
jgi:hypothetical protein